MTFVSCFSLSGEFSLTRLFADPLHDHLLYTCPNRRVKCKVQHTEQHRWLATWTQRYAERHTDSETQADRSSHLGSVGRECSNLVPLGTISQIKAANTRRATNTDSNQYKIEKGEKEAKIKDQVHTTDSEAY